MLNTTFSPSTVGRRPHRLRGQRRRSFHSAGAGPNSVPALPVHFPNLTTGFNGIVTVHSEVTPAGVTDNKDTTYLVGEKYMSPEHYIDGQDQGDLCSAVSGDSLSTIRWSCANCTISYVAGQLAGNSSFYARSGPSGVSAIRRASAARIRPAGRWRSWAATHSLSAGASTQRPTPHVDAERPRSHRSDEDSALKWNFGVRRLAAAFHNAQRLKKVRPQLVGTSTVQASS